MAEEWFLVGLQLRAGGVASGQGDPIEAVLEHNKVGIFGEFKDDPCLCLCVYMCVSISSPLPGSRTVP